MENFGEILPSAKHFVKKSIYSNSFLCEMTSGMYW